MIVLIFYIGLFAGAFFIVYALRRGLQSRQDFTSLKTVTFGDESAVRADRAASIISVVVIFLIIVAATKAKQLRDMFEKVKAAVNLMMDDNGLQKAKKD